VAPYIEEHKNIVSSANPGKPDSWIKEKHMETFGSWLRTRLMNDGDVGDQLYLLAASPSSTVFNFQGYEINGNTFYTVAQDKKRPTKTVVSALMQQEMTGVDRKTHTMVT
jgi:hypothetical protein